jgi:hypothetical protein
MDEDNSYDTRFETVTFDEEEFLYRSSNGEEIRFPQLLHVRLNGEEFDTKLSYTTLGGAKVPCIRVDGRRHNLDVAGLEIASDCIIPLG